LSDLARAAFVASPSRPKRLQIGAWKKFEMQHLQDGRAEKASEMILEDAGLMQPCEARQPEHGFGQVGDRQQHEDLDCVEGQECYRQA
jgi:hypothetical protein